MTAGAAHESSSSSRARRLRLRDRLVEDVLEPGRSSFGTAVILGSAGIGKTTFARELVTEAQRSEITVGWGVAGEFAGAPPLWPWSEALAAVDERHPLAHLADSTAPDLSGTAHPAMYQSVARWLNERSEQAPILLVLEDLHDADSSTLALFRYLSRRPRRGPWLVVATSRLGLEEMATLRCPLHHVEGLDVDELADMARSMRIDPSALDLAAVHASSEGNPLFARHLLEQHRLGGQSVHDLSSVVGAELARLSDRTRSVAEALAVLGTSSDAELVLDVAHLGSEAGAAAIDGDVLISIDQSIAFSHSLLREAVVAGLGSERRSELHVRAAQALTRRGDNPIRIAHHFGRASSTGGGTVAARFAAEAGRLALSAGAFPEAIEYCTSAVRLFENHGAPNELATALALEARALSYSGQISAAESRLAEAARVNTELGLESKMMLLREFIRLRWREEPNQTCLNPTRLTHLAESWLAGSDDIRAEAMLHLARVGAAEITGPVSADIDEARSAVAAAQQSGDLQLIGEAHLALRRTLMADIGTLPERREATAASIAAAARVEDPELLARARRMALSDAVAACDRTLAMALQASMETAPTAGLREHEALWKCGLATLEGRRDDAEKILDEASRELSYLGLEAPSLVFVRVIFGFDDGNLAAELAEFEPMLPVLADPLLDTAFAMGAAYAGDTARSVELLNRALPSLERDDTPVLWPVAVGMAAELAAGFGHERVPQILELIRPLAGQAVVPAAATIPWLGTYDRLIGLLHLRMGNPESAYASLTTSLDLHRSMWAHPWTARSHAGLALACHRLGRFDEADEHRADAARLADQFGMGDVLVVGDFDGAPIRTVASRPPIHTPPTTAIIRRSGGSEWEVGFGSSTRFVRDLDGMRHIEVLVDRPDTDWHVLDLYSLAAGASVVEGSSGPTIDHEARTAYQARYLELTAERDDAQQRSDEASLRRADAEIEALEAQLLSAFGLGGRPRYLDDPAERARVNVRRSITRAVQAITSVDERLGDHLRHRLVTGRFCRYESDPAHPYTWVTRP